MIFLDWQDIWFFGEKLANTMSKWAIWGRVTRQKRWKIQGKTAVTTKFHAKYLAAPRLIVSLVPKSAPNPWKKRDLGRPET